MESEAMAVVETSAVKARGRTRTGKKRLRFQAPLQMPPGVRELWRAAPSEEQAAAHQTCVEILSMWLGKKRKEEIAERLSIPPVRVWQLSQQALSGMLAGLLKQPRRRRWVEVAMAKSEDDPRALQKKIAQLEQRLRNQDDLIRLLAQLPKPVPPGATETSPPAAKMRRRKRARKANGSAGDVSGDAPARAG